jgi:hypothetical protein
MVEFSLEQENYELSEVVIVAVENPAEILLRKIIEHKGRTIPIKLTHYPAKPTPKCSSTPTYFQKLMDKKVLEPFRFVFEHLDTSTVNGKPIPGYAQRIILNLYYRRTPRARKEIINASQISASKMPAAPQFAATWLKMSISMTTISTCSEELPHPIAPRTALHKYSPGRSPFSMEWCYNIMV